MTWQSSASISIGRFRHRERDLWRTLLISMRAFDADGSVFMVFFYLSIFFTDMEVRTVEMWLADWSTSSDDQLNYILMAKI